MCSNKFCWLVIMSTALAWCGSALGQQNGREEKAMNYAGEWWLSRSSIEQHGYINGDADCYTSELHGELKGLASAEEVQAFVNQSYGDPAHWSAPVSRVIRTFDSRHATLHEPSSSEGEAWNETHGYWDGLWWKGGAIPRLEQLGYVEGYLACYQDEARSPKGTFSKAPSRYISLIGGWYKSTGKEDAKIADVLFKFRDQAQPSKPEGK